MKPRRNLLGPEREVTSLPLGKPKGQNKEQFKVLRIPEK